MANLDQDFDDLLDDLPSTPPRLVSHESQDGLSDDRPPQLEVHAALPQLVHWDESRKSLKQDEVFDSPSSQESPNMESAPTLGQANDFDLPVQEMSTEECAKKWLEQLALKPEIKAMNRPDQQLAFDDWRAAHNISGRNTGYGMVSYWLKWNGHADAVITPEQSREFSGNNITAPKPASPKQASPVFNNAPANGSSGYPASPSGRQSKSAAWNTYDGQDAEVPYRDDTGRSKQSSWRNIYKTFEISNSIF